MCHEGSVTWYNPVGAIRLEVSPMVTKAFRLCFIVESGNAKVKLSQEEDQKINTKAPSERHIYTQKDSNLKTIAATSGLSTEHCISSSKPILLYIESEHTERLGYQKVFLQYDVAPLTEVKEPSIEGITIHNYTLRQKPHMRCTKRMISFGAGFFDTRMETHICHDILFA